jgi:biopolymer transport protein ExbD
MKIPRTPARRPRIEMLPLIDIVFLLLVFFIYAMLSMALHRGLPVRLPVSSQSEVERELVLSVTVRADGGVFVDRVAVPLESLTELLRRRAMNSGEPGVLLFADRSVSCQQLFEVLDRIRKAGIARISLQAEAEAGT